MLPPTGHRPQCTRPSAASFTSASQPPPPAASRTAPRSSAAPPPDAQPPLATLRRPSPDHWPGSLAVTVAPPPHLPTHSASEPPVAPPYPFATTIGLLPPSFPSLLVYTLVHQSSPRPTVSYTVLRWLAIPRLLTVTIGHFLLTFLNHWSPCTSVCPTASCRLPQSRRGRVHGPATPWPPAPSPSLLATAAKAFVPSPIDHNLLGPPLSSSSPIKSQTLHKSTLPPSWTSRRIAITAA